MLPSCLFIWFDFSITDPGPGVLHDDVLSVGESRDFLRLKKTQNKSSVRLHTWVAFHQRGTNIDPCSSFIPPPSLPLQTLLRRGVPYQMAPVAPVQRFPCYLSNKHSDSVITELLSLFRSVSKANFCDSFYETVLWRCIKDCNCFCKKKNKKTQLFLNYFLFIYVLKSKSADRKMLQVHVFCHGVY